MVPELKPYQLVQTYAEARHSRINSWVFSLLAAGSTIAGFGIFVNADLPNPIRYGGTFTFWGTALVLVNRGSVASKQANIYGKRVTALEQFSEESFIHSLAQSVRPGLDPIQLSAQLETTGNPEADAVLQCLADFDIESRFERAIRGPSFTRLFLKPQRGQKVNQIMNLGSELQLALGLENPPLISVKPAGLAVDIPNVSRSILKFSQFIPFESRSPLEPLLLAVGVDLDGQLVELDLSDPNTCHVLGGGTTGSGKSEFLRTAVLSLIGRYSPAAVKVAIGDPKRVTFNEFENSAWMYAPIAKTPQELIDLLNSLVTEMDNRYQALEWAGVADLASYNQSTTSPYPRIVTLLDEYGEALDQATKDQADIVQKLVRRLAQKARAAGIHLLLFTQRPDANKLDPQLRSNLPASIGLKVQRQEESTIIMGTTGSGAENLLGKGDLLLRAGNEVVRLQAPLVDSPILVRQALNRYPALTASTTVEKQQNDSVTLEQFRQEFKTPQTPRELLENCLKASATDFPELEQNKTKQINFDLDDLLPELQPIVRYSIKQGGWVKAIDCKRNIRSLKSVSTEVIREYFVILSNQGCGSLKGDGDQSQYNAFEG